MKCPYNHKSKTEIQTWKQNTDEYQTLTDGKTITQTVFELAECGKENCGAWQNGKCCYNHGN